MLQETPTSAHDPHSDLHSPTPQHTLPPQHVSPFGPVQDCPSGMQATPPHRPFVQVEPVLQQGCEPSQVAPSRTHAPPQNPSTHGAPEQHGLCEEQSAPSGMHVGCGFTQTPEEQTSPESGQHGWAASHVAPNNTQPPHRPFVQPPEQQTSVSVHDVPVGTHWHFPAKQLKPPQQGEPAEVRVQEAPEATQVLWHEASQVSPSGGSQSSPGSIRRLPQTGARSG